MSTDRVGRIVVGYLATASGDDGVALAVALARATGAAIDLVCVVQPVPQDGNPGIAGYQQRLENQAATWLEQGAQAVPDDIERRTIVTLHESFTEGLIEVAQQSADAIIVVGGTSDGVMRRHALGTISTGLVHSSPLPVALAPRGYADRERAYVDMVTVAVPHRPGRADPVPFAVSLAQQGSLELRLLTLVSHPDGGNDAAAAASREAQIASASEQLDRASAAAGADLEVESVVVDGETLDAALADLTWDDGDVVALGSGHLGRPQRVFLGSTAARILRWTTAPVIVVPRT